MWLTDAWVVQVHARKQIISICKSSRNFSVKKMCYQFRSSSECCRILYIFVVFLAAVSRKQWLNISSHLFNGHWYLLHDDIRIEINWKELFVLRSPGYLFAFKKQSGINIVFITIPFQNWSSLTDKVARKHLSTTTTTIYWYAHGKLVYVRSHRTLCCAGCNLLSGEQQSCSHV